MQNNYKILRSIFLNFLFACYIIFSLVTLQNCKYNKEESTSEKLVQKKQEASKLLLQKFDAELFNCNINSILNKTAVLDTLLLGISQRGTEKYLKARVVTSCGDKYFAKLKCSEEIIEKYNRTKSNRAYLAAKITRIDKVDLFANADTLDGKCSELVLGKSILLSGECISLVEIETQLD
jgi:hypothetical protein